MPSNDLGSLSKEFPLEQIEATLALARGGMSYAEYRRLAGRQTHVELAAITAKRFLFVRNGRIVRDEFLALLEREGIGSPKCRKVMFGIWALRDVRLRNFILERVADPLGHWRANELVNKSNAQYFRTLFAAQTASKARSNVEYFLSETQILLAGVVQLSTSDGWLFDAVRIYSQHIEDVNLRAEMQDAPSAYLLRTGYFRLANITAAELGRISIPPPPGNEEGLEHNAPSRTGVISGTGTRWARQRPVFVTGPRTIFERDPVALERASTSHHTLERLLAHTAEAIGIEARTNASIDIFFQSGNSWVLAEIKSAHDLNYHMQVRRGVSQLFEYAFRAREEYAPAVLLLILETIPPIDRRWLVPYLNSLRITIAWPNAIKDGFETSGSIPDELAALIRAA